MSQASERRKKPRSKPAEDTTAIWVTLHKPGTAPAEVRAWVMDLSEGGIQIETPVPLDLNTSVVLNGAPLEGGSNGKLQAHVVRCSPAQGGRYSIGLSYGSNGHAKKVDPVADYYEILQVHSKADPETIHRVYRILAQRFHPDNTETGNADAFRAILGAYKVLSDPEKRASYDVNLQEYRQVRWRLFDQADAAVGKRAERRKRRGVLELLYTARMNQPTNPSLNLHEFEDLLGCPREHLEFTLWYLRENAMLTRTDNGRYTITAKGVDRVEADDAEAKRDERLLPAANAK